MTDNYFKDTFHSNQGKNTDENATKTPIKINGIEYTAFFDDSELSLSTTSDIDVYRSRLPIRIEL